MVNGSTGRWEKGRKHRPPLYSRSDAEENASIGSRVAKSFQFGFFSELPFVIAAPAVREGFAPARLIGGDARGHPLELP